MTGNSTIPADAILNPYTPLAFLPPDVADQYQIMGYIYVATLAVSSLKCWAPIDLILYTYRLTHGIGSWRCRRSTKLSAK
jgi:hypothetical protein